MLAPATSLSWVSGVLGSRSVAEANPCAAGRLWAILPPATVSTRLSAASSPVNVIGSPAAFTVTVAEAVAGRASAAAAATAPTSAKGFRRAAFMTGLLGSVDACDLGTRPGRPLFRELRHAWVVTPELQAAVLGDHLDRLYRAAWALTGAREDAEDLVQETYERVLRRPREIARAEDALPYLLGVLRNTWVDTVRSRARRPTVPLDADAEDRVAGGSPLDRVAAREVFEVVAGLPAEWRDTLAAVDVAGLSYSEAAEALGVPIGTIMSRLSRGRQRVAETLGSA
jgi:RNA polymerase sigma-70 factor (ECF subfamily)